MTRAFKSRMAELDTLVLKCRGREPFCSGVVRDTSNRSNRDWPWWSVEVEHSQVDGAENRRATAMVTLASTQAGEPGAFQAEWAASIWRSTGGAATETIRGRIDVPWQRATADSLSAIVTALLDEAKAAIPAWAKA